MDVGCGVASYGAYLLSRNVVTMSVAPKDVHENQIQFALERGVPAMVAAFSTRRLLYPSQAFDLIHCSRCRINWTSDGMIVSLLTPLYYYLYIHVIFSIQDLLIQMRVIGIVASLNEEYLFVRSSDC